MYGELDLATVADFEAELRLADASSAPTIVIDLAELASIDSTGLRSLVLFHERCEVAERRLIIRPGSHRLQKVFEATQLDDRLPFEEG